MNELKSGWYSVSHNGKVEPAFYDGGKWTTFDGHQHVRKNHNPTPIALSCPTGCTCTTNPDGSVNVSCPGGDPENP